MSHCMGPHIAGDRLAWTRHRACSGAGRDGVFAPSRDLAGSSCGEAIPMGKPRVQATEVRVPVSAPDTAIDSDGDRRRHEASGLGPESDLFSRRRPLRSDPGMGR